MTSPLLNRTADSMEMTLTAAYTEAAIVLRHGTSEVNRSVMLLSSPRRDAWSFMAAIARMTRPRRPLSR